LKFVFSFTNPQDELFHVIIQFKIPHKKLKSLNVENEFAGTIDVS